MLATIQADPPQPGERPDFVDWLSLERRGGSVELVRPDGKIGKLSQPGQPDRLVALARREVRDCLAEELRRLDPDEIYGAALAGIAKISRGRAPISLTMDGATA